MKRLYLLIAAVCLGISVQAAKNYGSLRVTASKAVIYHGADLQSKPEAEASEGDEFVLRDDGLIHGFYKIEYQGHVSFINAGAVELVKEQVATPLPLPKPTLAATRQVTSIPTLKPTLAPSADPTASVPVEVTAVVRPHDEGVDPGEPQPLPSPRPRVATPEPLPTATALPEKLMATPVLRAYTTALPEKIQPTPVRRPEVGPTDEPTLVPSAVPLDSPTVGRAKRRNRPLRERDLDRPERRIFSREERRMSPAPVFGPSRPVMPRAVVTRVPGQLSKGVLYLPLGSGWCYPVQPAFKPDAAAQECRCIESAAFVGLGLEGRTGWRWLRIFGDLSFHNHTTLAARKGETAYAVLVPRVNKIIFNESDVQYGMTTAGLRLGAKISLPFSRVEPWVGGGLGLYSWKADYASSDDEFSYGDDKGVAFGATALAGIDFNFPLAGGGIWVLTPFAEYGSPIVYPTVRDIASTGSDWKDTYGTPVMLPWRLGVSIGFGF